MAEPQRTDDPTIEDQAKLWRRIHPSNLLVRDGQPRPQSISFVDRHTGELSVDIASLTTIDKVLEGFPGHSVAEFTAGDIRRLGCMVCRDPTPDNPAHAVIVPRLTVSKAKKLANRDGILAHTGTVAKGTP